MQEAFPELRRVAGFVGAQEHFWCVSPTGEIVDPTAGQFRAEPKADDYREFQPGDEVRVGKCMNCGEPIYAKVESLDNPKHHRSACSHECEDELRAAFS